MGTEKLKQYIETNENNGISSVSQTYNQHT